MDQKNQLVEMAHELTVLRMLVVAICKQAPDKEKLQRDFLDATSSVAMQSALGDISPTNQEALGRWVHVYVQMLRSG